MRVVIQRVKKAEILIDEKPYSGILKGLLIFLAVEDSDDITDIDWLSNKIANLRIFNDSEGKMNLSIMDAGGEILVVSQFTLYASTKKGNRPSYIKSSKPEVAIPIYEKFILTLRQVSGKPVKTGVFGAMMEVSLVNDGPVTIIIDTKEKE
jgi:D-aminoacyl-tRNA deacylase